VIRPYREGDIPAIASVVTACYAGDGIDVVLGQDELAGQFNRGEFDPALQVLVAEGAGTEGLPSDWLAAAAWVRLREDPEHNERLYFIEMGVHPAAQRTELPAALFDGISSIIRGMEAERAPVGGVRVKAFGSDKAAWYFSMLRDLGFRESRRFQMMVRPLDDIEEPADVEGVTIRLYRVPEDHEGAHATINSSFADHFDYQPRTQEDWNGKFAAPFCRPDLSWVAEVDAEPGKIASISMAAVYGEENEALNRRWGWVESVGTLREWRGRGLARSLILRTMHSLKSAGMETAGLGVDTHSLTGATHLYSSLGFETHEMWLEFERPLDEDPRESS
jgi:mycothiol synthase